MKKQSLKNIKLNKRVISALSITSVLGGRFRAPLEGDTDISYCHAGTNNDCCA